MKKIDVSETAKEQSAASSRRSFLKSASVGAAGASGLILGAPAIAQTGPTRVDWRMTTSFPKAIDAVYGGGEELVDRVRAATDGRFNIKLSPPGELAPAMAAVDVVEKGDVECAHSCFYYYGKKSPAWLIGTTVPFGLNFRQYNAWYYFGGGAKLLNDLAAKSNLVCFLGGNSGVQMGWSKRQLRSLDDIKGLKIRIAGMGGDVFREMGAEPTTSIPGGEIVAALQANKIEAAEWVGPYDDEKMGLHKVAKYYYYPGFWETASAVHFFVNKTKWDKLPKEFQEAFISATYAANANMMAKYDYANPLALARILKEKVIMEKFDDTILNRAYGITQDILSSYANKNADFKTILTSYQAFGKASNIWTRFAEGTLDRYMGGAR